MLELIKKVNFVKDIELHKRIRDYVGNDLALPFIGGSASMEAVDWDEFYYGKTFSENNATISSLENNEFYNHLNSFLSIQTPDDYVNFIVEKGIYYVLGSKAPPLATVPTAYFAFDVIRTINEIKENLALVESNNRTELDKKFKWSLRESTYNFTHWPLYLTESYFRRHKKYFSEFKSYREKNIFVLPDEISPNDYKSAVNYMAGLIINIYLEPVVCIINTNQYPFSIVPIIPNYMEFIWLVFTDTLTSGTKYKICESCGKTFTVEVKPGREPSVCSGTCRNRKHRRKPK